MFVRFKELCQPAIHYAKTGVVVSPRVALDWQISLNNLKGTSQKFYTKSGNAYQNGDVFFAPQQAYVLEKFAKYGAKGFYEGEVVEDLISSLNKLGAFILLMI